MGTRCWQAPCRRTGRNRSAAGAVRRGRVVEGEASRRAVESDNHYVMRHRLSVSVPQCLKLRLAVLSLHVRADAVTREAATAVAADAAPASAAEDVFFLRSPLLLHCPLHFLPFCTCLASRSRAMRVRA